MRWVPLGHFWREKLNELDVLLTEKLTDKNTSFLARWGPPGEMATSLVGFCYSDTIFISQEHVWALALDRLQYLLESFILCCHSLCKLNT